MVRHIPHGGEGGSRRWSDIYHMGGGGSRRWSDIYHIGGGEGGVGGGQTYTTWGGVGGGQTYTTYRIAGNFHGVIFSRIHSYPSIHEIFNPRNLTTKHVHSQLRPAQVVRTR